MLKEKLHNLDYGRIKEAIPCSWKRVDNSMDFGDIQRYSFPQNNQEIYWSEWTVKVRKVWMILWDMVKKIDGWLWVSRSKLRLGATGTMTTPKLWCRWNNPHPIPHTSSWCLLIPGILLSSILLLVTQVALWGRLRLRESTIAKAGRMKHGELCLLLAISSGITQITSTWIVF